MHITNGQVFLPEGRFEKSDILCGDRITAITGGDTHMTVQELPDGEMIDATGKYIIPGLVDIHTHGAVNADASDGDADGLRRMSRYYAQRGVTSWCPTTMTLSEKSLLHAMHAIRDFESDGAHCVGVHLEGPFLSYEKRRGTECTVFAETEYGRTGKIKRSLRWTGTHDHSGSGRRSGSGIYPTGQQALYGFPGALCGRLRYGTGGFRGRCYPCYAYV